MCRKVMKSGGGGGGGGNIFRGVWGHAPQKFFWCLCALRQLLVQSEAKILTELLNICG